MQMQTSPLYGGWFCIWGRIKRMVKYANAASRNSSIWYVKGLSAGVHAISSTYSAANQASIAAASFFGVNQTSPLDASSSLSITSSTVSSTLTASVAGDLIIDALDSAATQTSTAIGPNQQYIMKNLATAANTGNASYQIASSSGAKTESYHMSISNGFNFSVAAFKAATGATSSATSSIIQYVSTDDLGGTNVVTNASGTLARQWTTILMEAYGSTTRRAAPRASRESISISRSIAQQI